MIEGIHHDALAGYVANEHIDWTGASENFETTGTTKSSGVTVEAAAQPTVEIVDTGNPSARVFAAIAGTRLDLTCNAYYTGAAWNRDDVSKASGLFTCDSTGRWLCYYATGEANPISWEEMWRIDADGFNLKTGDFIADGSAGVTTTFTNADGDTVTVKSGIITDVS